MADYIDLEALLYDIEASMENNGMGYVIGQTLKRYVKRQPAADVAPVRHGKWVRQDNTFTRYECSVCISRNHGGYERYCPSCGAKMDLED